ncbi:uncharacterized protein LOC122049285 [Zingiber officinale]|nr:uncharacterized protein LOC122043867 [Zingiber officinale]XP_042466622.1 uncharacterized protein LOC122049285 [Zingiber officinale]KAG6528657.1 hypothetical protein ZIOFF_010841 [Zingiber officinale]
MNQRSRSSRAKPSPSSVDERIHRFLRPGALARLRDSRISTARSASLALLDLALPSFPSPHAPPPAQIDGVRPFFASRTYGPQFLRRKKLAAAKSVYIAPSSPDLADPFLEAFGVDLVAAY